jgi:non-canonical purine NTP pyrophosphatase (RdgB/HAM1 family)
MKIYCITGNSAKFEEIAKLMELPIEQLSVDVPEIQELSLEAVVRHKLMAARTRASAGLIVEDTALTFACLGNALPGPLVKWFEKGIGLDGMVALATKAGNVQAVAHTMVGYLDLKGGMHFFEGKTEGIIVSPRGTGGFGWDAIFQPRGATATFAEMTSDQKAVASMRTVAVKQLNSFLAKQS